MIITNEQLNDHADVGRRLYAAILSAQLGIGMDYALRKYVPMELHYSWGELGWTLQQAISKSTIAALVGTDTNPKN